MVRCNTCKTSRKTISSKSVLNRGSGNRIEPNRSLYKPRVIAEPIPYEMTRSYNKGDRVGHKIYGDGEVKEVNADFMIVRFETGTKRLICKGK